jgi:bacterioferritin
MEHKELDFGEADLKSQLERQIQLESNGIDRYTEQIKIIDDEEVVGVLKHILDEEKRHRKEFRTRLEELD